MQDSFVDVWSCRMPSCNGIIFGNRRHAPSDSHPLVMQLFLPIHVNVPNATPQHVPSVAFHPVKCGIPPREVWHMFFCSYVKQKDKTRKQTGSFVLMSNKLKSL